MKNKLLKSMVMILTAAIFLTFLSCKGKNDPANTPEPSDVPGPTEDPSLKYEEQLPEAIKDALNAVKDAYGKLISEIEINGEMIEKESYQTLGNTKRTEDVIKRSLKGEKITIGVIGESMFHEGEQKDEISVADRILKFWNDNFHPIGVPGCAEGRDASVSANSLTNVCFRMEKDLLSYKPDLVIYSVNHMHDAVYDKAAFESTLARLVKSGAAVIVLVVCAEQGIDNTKAFAKIAEHYDVPVVSWAQAFAKSKTYGDKINYADLTVDTVHPNTRGLECVEASLEYYFKEVIGKISEGNETQEDVIFPAEPSQKNGWFFMNSNYIDRNDPDRITIESKGGFQDDSVKLNKIRQYDGWYSEAGGEAFVATVKVENGIQLLMEHSERVGSCKITFEDAETNKKIAEFTADNNSWYLYSWNTGFKKVSKETTVRITVEPTGNTCILAILAS